MCERNRWLVNAFSFKMTFAIMNNELVFQIMVFHFMVFFVWSTVHTVKLVVFENRQNYVLLPAGGVTDYPTYWLVGHSDVWCSFIAISKYVFVCLNKPSVQLAGNTSTTVCSQVFSIFPKIPNELQYLQVQIEQRSLYRKTLLTLNICHKICPISRKFYCSNFTDNIIITVTANNAIFLLILSYNFVQKYHMKRFNSYFNATFQRNNKLSNKLIIIKTCPGALPYFQ